MAFTTGARTLTGIDLYKSTADVPSGLGIGSVIEGDHGKRFKLVKAGATLVKGNLLQEAAELTTYENMVVGTAGVVGDKYLQITNGTSTITAEQYKGGTIGVYTAGTVAVGDEYVITDVTGTLTTGGALKVWLDRKLRYAYTTSATVNMRRNVASGVIQFPQTTQTGIPVGVAIYEIPSGEYGFVQTWGECTALSDASTFAVGSQLSPSLSVAGAVGVNVAGTTHGVVGWARQAAASAKGISIFLQIA